MPGTFFGGLEYMDVELPLVTGDLTATGVQYSAEVTVGANANVDATVLSVTINPVHYGNQALIAIEFGLTAEFVADVANVLKWKWQARNSAGTWVDLHAEVTETNLGVAYVSRTRQGKFLIQTNLTRPKIDIQLLLQSNEASIGSAKVNAASYVRLIYI